MRLILVGREPLQLLLVFFGVPLSRCPRLLLGEKRLLPGEDRFLAPENLFSNAYGWREIAGLHHVFHGTGRNAKAGADLRFGEQRRQLVVEHGVSLKSGHLLYSFARATTLNFIFK